jgi:large subunit ribosomal protein L22
VLASAVANAEANHGLVGDELYVSVATVGSGPTIKRWRARARGRVARIKKRTCHITIALAVPEGVEAAVSRAPAAAPEEVGPGHAPPAKDTDKPKRAPRKKAEAPADTPEAAEEAPKPKPKRTAKPKAKAETGEEKPKSRTTKKTSTAKPKTTRKKKES